MTTDVRTIADAILLEHTVLIDKCSSACANCGANVLNEGYPCPGCATNFRFAAYGYIMSPQAEEEADIITLEGFGIRRIGTYRGTPGTSSLELIRTPTQ